MMHAAAEHDAPDMGGFGVLLNGPELESHLRRLRTMQQAYAASNPGDVVKIKASMDQASKHDHH
jgi:hypothetical protein